MILSTPNNQSLSGVSKKNGIKLGVGLNSIQANLPSDSNIRLYVKISNVADATDASPTSFHYVLGDAGLTPKIRVTPAEPVYVNITAYNSDGTAVVVGGANDNISIILEQ